MNNPKLIKESYNRILEISEDSLQITLPDSRYYRRNGQYYPSVTYVLNYYPKNETFLNWLKDVGRSADHIAEKAAKEGTQVHQMVEDYLLGEELNFLSPNMKPQYDVKVWKMFLNFVEFWETYKPKLIETEILLFSDELRVAGTCDLVCEIDNQLWVIDLKTSNNIHTTYDLQTSIYVKMYEECFGKKVDRAGILWLKSTKRKFSKEKMQGKGWEIYESSRSQEENLEIFKNVHQLFNLENPNSTPSFETFKTTAKREI